MKQWAALTLVGAIVATGAIAVARADAGHNPAGLLSTTHCASKKHACIDAYNKLTGPGVEGFSFTGAGVWGSSAAGPGVYATGDYGYGMLAASANNAAIYADGDVQVTGQIFTGGSCKSGCTKSRHQVSFAPRSSQPTIDDVGEATLRNGSARVALAADFANVIDTRRPYVVLLTPEGDAALYVANRTSTGFEVRQVGGGRASIPFAYRIVAKPYAVEDERLPFKAVSGSPDAIR